MDLEVQEKLNTGEKLPLLNDLSTYVSFIVECCWYAHSTAQPISTDICSMLQNAKLLLLDEKSFGEWSSLFFYLDEDYINRNIFYPNFLHY